MDEPLTGAVDPARLPRGVAVRYSGPAVSDRWHAAVTLPDGRVGLAVGRCPGPQDTGRGAAVADELLATADPQRALAVLPTGSAALCAVITPADCTMRYCTLAGDGPGVVVAAAQPQATPELLDAAPETTAIELPRGSILLLSSRAHDEMVALLGDLSGEPPHRCAEMFTEALTTAGHPGELVTVYRCPPAPLELTMPAEPKNLAVVRDRMRRWLNIAGVDPESTADALLAVGEAASNCSEHAVLGVSHPVQLTVRAAVDGHRLRFTVSDNGRWKPATATTGVRSHRGHGIKLITALVDAAEVTTDEHGTTVEMLKELSP